MKQFNKSIQGKLFHYFQQRLRIKASTKGWWRSDCPLCGGKYTFGIHLSESRAHCFKCLESLKPLRLLMVMEKFETINEVYKYLSIQQEYEYYDTYSKLPIREFKQVELPQGFKLLTQGENIIAKAARHYMHRRGFNIEKLALNGIGYCDEGEYNGYIIFPYYRKGELVYYQGRIFQGGGTKMKNPPDTQFGVGKSQVVYNLDAFYIYQRAYIVESITNSLTLGDPAGGINGKRISEHQLSQILMSPCSSIVILLDPDAYTEALQLGMQLSHYKKVKVVKLPGEKDVNDLGRSETLKYVKETPWQSYMDLYRIKINLNEPTTINTYFGKGPNYVDRRGL